MPKSGSARGVRLICPKCTAKFTVVAFLTQAVNAAEYWKQRADEHDCEGHAKALAAMKSSDGTKTPQKPPKAAEKGKKCPWPQPRHWKDPRPPVPNQPRLLIVNGTSAGACR